MKTKRTIVIVLTFLASIFWFKGLNLRLISLRYNTPLELYLKNWWLIYGYFALLIGVILGTGIATLLNTSSSEEQNLNVIDELKFLWKRIDFWVAMFASPIIYGCVINVMPIPVIQYLYFALQTGFCVLLIIRVLINRF